MSHCSAYNKTRKARNIFPLIHIRMVNNKNNRTNRFKEKCYSILKFLSSGKEEILTIKIYRNDSKFSDRKDWANSADPDQTAHRGAV